MWPSGPSGDSRSRIVARPTDFQFTPKFAKRVPVRSSDAGLQKQAGWEGDYWTVLNLQRILPSA
jgi:hypothetical protein